MYGLSPSEVLVVGDSVKKDIAVAQTLGFHDVWAEYGTYCSLEYRERLDIISSAAITRRHAAHVFESGQQQLAPTRSISNFNQVLGIVDLLSAEPGIR
jgi:FMN phosphatase YigB (HAD superfamily)